MGGLPGEEIDVIPTQPPLLDLCEGDDWDGRGCVRDGKCGVLS
jgi:hypothetical protein